MAAQAAPCRAQLVVVHRLLPHPKVLPHLVQLVQLQLLEGVEELQLTLPLVQSWGRRGVGRGG